MSQYCFDMEDPAKYETVSGLSKTHRKKVACPYCKGEGIIEQRKFYGHTDGWTLSNHKCGVCNGSRVLERIITIDYKNV